MNAVAGFSRESTKRSLCSQTMFYNNLLLHVLDDLIYSPKEKADKSIAVSNWTVKTRRPLLSRILFTFFASKRFYLIDSHWRFTVLSANKSCTVFCFFYIVFL